MACIPLSNQKKSRSAAKLAYWYFKSPLPCGAEPDRGTANHSKLLVRDAVAENRGPPSRRGAPANFAICRLTGGWDHRRS